MPVITKIVVQKRNKDRYSIFTSKGNKEEYAFSVDEEVLIKYQLKKGMELDDVRITEMLYQDDIRKAYNMAIGYLAHRMRSEGEMREHLANKEISDSISSKVIQRLLEQNYLNDLEFAKAFVRTQINTNDKGPDVVSLELKKKGVKEQVIEEALREFTLERQIEKAIKLGNKFAIKNKKDSSKILKQKLEQQLLRKGYPFSVIREAMEEIHSENETDEEMEALRHQGAKLVRKYAKLDSYEFKQKMKQSLYRKGFSIDLIERYLGELEE